MGWVATLNHQGHITEAIIHFNQAIEALGNRMSMVEVSRSLSDALNKIQTEWVLHQDSQTMSEVKAFQTMILKEVGTEGHTTFLKNDEIKNLVFFQPPIMNNDTLRRHRYSPDQELDPQLVKKASEEHHKLVVAYRTYLSLMNKENGERVIKQAAELLYIVRSNIAHGEKTPYGPDLKKKERDEEVCKVVMPLQRLLLNVLLDYPDRQLVVYGTLAPGNVNHHIISDIQGYWEDCTVNGHVYEINGLPLFVWEPRGPSLKAQLFTSSVLPSRWKQIDEFEGYYYKRILIPVARNDGIAIANIYVAIHNSEVKKWRH